MSKMFDYDTEITDFICTMSEDYGNNESTCECETPEECKYFLRKYGHENENNKKLLIEYMGKVYELANRLDKLGIKIFSEFEYEPCVCRMQYSYFTDSYKLDLYNLFKLVFKFINFHRENFRLIFCYFFGRDEKVDNKKEYILTNIKPVCEDLGLTFEWYDKSSDELPQSIVGLKPGPRPMPIGHHLIPHIFT